jgi:glycosyltransferase involved in cell wall biosynthesis
MTTSPAPSPYLRAPVSIRDELGSLPGPAKQAFVSRLDLLVKVLGHPQQDLDTAIALVASEVGHRPDLLWLSRSVLAGELPSDEDMAELLVRARLGGTWAALLPVLTRLRKAGRFREVEVVTDAVTCDIHTTASSEFLSGIQRVVRETTSRWLPAHPDLHLVGWNKDMTALRRLREDEKQRVFDTTAVTATAAGVPPVVVPWGCTHLWIEVVTDLRRIGRILAMAQYSRNEVCLLGYDSIPVTSSVTVSDGMTSHFARGLAAARHTTRVAMISSAAAAEFRGVMAMGSGRRQPAPRVETIPLAVAAPSARSTDLAEARAGLLVDGSPMVLVVGSHEPRKNHLAVLHASEVLWREGVVFNLVLLGAGAWNDQEYHDTLDALVSAGRPVQSIRGMPDRLLASAYRLAHCTVFPSLNEGFGLPVAESLSVGTPVITSNFGSMRDIVAPHGDPLGALLVDPRSDTELTGALRQVLTDVDLHARLSEEAAHHRRRTWDTYAAELWAYLVEGEQPGE